MRVHDATDDGFGHSPVLAIDDRENGSVDPRRRRDGVDLIRVECSDALRAPDRERDDGNPSRKAEEKLRVMGDGVAKTVVRRFRDHSPDVLPVGGGENRRDRAHRMTFENEAFFS